jgi:hypothetical protein
LTSLDFTTERCGEQVGGVPTELRASDTEDLATFLVSVFGGEREIWKDWFAHWWTLNPARRRSIPCGWAVRSPAGAIIAFTANIPSRYVIDGKPAFCCATGCTAVDTNWRGLGLAKAVGRKFLDQPHGDLLVGVDSTPVAFGLWRALGMQALDERWLKNHSRVLADGAALGTALSQKTGLPSIVGRVAGACISLWLDSPIAAHSRSKSLSVTKIDGFSERDADDIAICRASNASTYSYRDVGTLNWLYFGSPFLSRTRTVLVARSGSQLVGYLAMKQWSPHSHYLLECRCHNADPEIARELILAARELARQNRAQTIVVRPYTRMIEAAIPPAVSIQIGRPATTYCYKFRTGDVSTENWETAPGDGDISVN